MTVNTELSKRIYTGNGVATDYDYDFKIPLAGDLAVSLFDLDGVELPQVLNTDYTVTGAGGDTGGKVLFSVAPPAGYTILLLSDAAYTQPTDFKNQGRFFPETHENAIDRAVILSRQNREAISRSITLPPQVSGVSTQLPVPQVSTLFGWNGNGSAIENFPLSTIATQIAYGDKNYQVFAGTGAQVNFTLSQNPGSLGNLDVSIDGVVQVPGTDYTYSGTTLTFTSAPADAAVILVRYDVAVPVGTGLASAINFQQSGTGAVVRSSQDKAREVVSAADYLQGGDIDDGPSIQRAANYLMGRRGGTVLLPNRKYTSSTTILVDRSANSALGRVSFAGDSEFGTWLEYTGSGVCFDIRNNDDPSGEQAASYQSISNMLITGSGSGTGISVNLGSFIDFNNLNIQGFEYGIDCVDVDQSAFYRVKCRFNDKGVRLRKNPSPGVSSTQPNSDTFFSCNLSNNADYGGLFVGGACINFFGGSVENNGASGASGYGLKFQDCGYEGGVGCNLNGVYFESNNGVADCVLEGLAVGGLTQVVHSMFACSFNRVSTTNVSTNCILATFGDPSVYSLQKLNISGVTFKSLGSYTPSAGRPYIAFNGVPANKDNFYQVGCLYEDALETPTFLQNLNKRYAKLTKASDQSLAGTGVAATWAIDTISSSVSWTPGIAAGVVTIDEAGYYAIDCFAVFSSAAAGIKKVLFYRNGTLIGYGEGSQDAVTASMTERFAAGDTLTVQMSQATGGAINIVASLSRLGVVKHFD